MRLSLLILGTVFIVQASHGQELSYCDWRFILDRSHLLVSELEENIDSLGNASVSFEVKDKLLEFSLDMFAREAAIRSDIEPDPARKEIVRGLRLDPPDAYLDNVGLYYDNLHVEYRDLQVSYMKLGKRFKKPEITFEFTRVLSGVGADGTPYEDIVDREVTFNIKKNSGEWVPYINVIDYDQQRETASQARSLVTEVTQGCQSEQLIALENERVSQEEAIEAINETAEAELSEVQNNEEISDQEQAESLREIQERKQREIEERERAIKELRRRELAEQKRIRLKARRKRLFTPTLFLGGAGLGQNTISVLEDSGEDTGKILYSLSGGVDLAYVKASASIMVENAALENNSIAANGFPEAGTATADSINVFTASLVGGLPLMLGKEVVFFMGGGGMFSSFSFTNNGEDVVDRFNQIAPIAQASLTWVLPERGGGFTLAYRKSFGAKYTETDELGLYVHYYIKTSR